MADYRLELPVNGTSYVLSGHQDDETGRILLDIAVRADGEAAPARVGSLAVSPDHLSILARALPRVLRDLAAAFPSRDRHSMAAIRTKYPRAYQPWQESEQQQLREAFNPDAPTWPTTFRSWPTGSSVSRPRSALGWSTSDCCRVDDEGWRRLGQQPHTCHPEEHPDSAFLLGTR